MSHQKKLYQSLWNGHKRIQSNNIFVDQSEVSKLLWATKLSDVIGDFIVLTKKTQDFVGKCPFCRPLTHNDKHFHVSDKRRRYKCFECGVVGKHPSSFLIRYFNKGFEDVVYFINYRYHQKAFDLKKTVRSVKGNCTDENSPF